MFDGLFLTVGTPPQNWLHLFRGLTFLKEPPGGAELTLQDWEGKRDPTKAPAPPKLGSFSITSTF